MVAPQQPMTFLQRAGYAFVVAIVVGSAASLLIVLATADGIDLLPKSAFDWAGSLYLFVPIWIMAFLLSPRLSVRFKIKRW